jgi:hypothetical protein
MVRVTMMRGAQSGGTVTYVPLKNKGLKGIRSRVVNGKRTDLSKLIHDKTKKGGVPAASKPRPSLSIPAAVFGRAPSAAA